MFSRVSQSVWTSTHWDLTLEVSDSSVIFTKSSQVEPKINVFSDATLNEAAQILRLLHIEELRELQTKINEAIVAVQAIIADPKTDHRLGKVGRWGDEEGSWRKKGRDWKLNIYYWTRDYFFVCCGVRSDCLSWEKLKHHILKLCMSCWSVASFRWTSRSDLTLQRVCWSCHAVVVWWKDRNAKIKSLSVRDH